MFIESPRFPDHVSMGALGGGSYRTDVVVVESGHEQRNQTWAQSRASYEVSHAARLPHEYEPLQAFFHAVGGRLHSFRFKDWTDYKATATQGAFVELTSTTFQMVKRYTAGALSRDRTISKPVSGTVTVTGGTTPTIDYTTGIVTVASGTPTAWAGEFDVPCRFDTDTMRGEIIDKNVGKGFIMGWNSIPIVEVRV